MLRCFVAELSGPHVDQPRDDIMRKMLANPPKPHKKMKIGKEAAKIVVTSNKAFRLFIQITLLK